MTWAPHMWPFAKVHPVNGMPSPAGVQAAAMTFCADKPKTGVWLEQGLGKSVIDLAMFASDLQHDRVDAHCIIAPNYLKSNWDDEANLWRVGVPLITWPTQVHSSQIKKPHIFVINYEAAQQSGGDYLEGLLKKNRYSMTLDESTAIKNFKGITTLAVRRLAAECSIRRSLTGTPMPQNVMDLWSQLRFLGQINGVNPYQFRNQFAVMGGYMGKQIKGVRNEEELQKILDRCVFRALKRDWWKDMPEKIYVPIEMEMTKKQRAAYQSMLDDFYYEVCQDDAIYADQVIHMKIKLQQISRGFILDKDNDRVVELMPPKENPAVRVVKAAIEDTPGKVIVAAHHVYSVEMLTEQLKGFGVVTMRGGMQTEEVAAVKRQFNEDPNTKVIVGMDSVMFRGHTLIGTEKDRCATTIFFENSYRREVRDQLEDRNHRFGQDRGVRYLDLFCSREDRAIVDAIQNKRNLEEAIVNAVRAFPRAA